MYSKIRAVSAEGRMAAKVIGGLPFFVAGALNALTPTFFGSVSTDPLFPVLMAVACVLWLVGIVIFMKMIRIRV
jgi:tight adherence protein B